MASHALVGVLGADGVQLGTLVRACASGIDVCLLPLDGGSASADGVVERVAALRLRALGGGGIGGVKEGTQALALGRNDEARWKPCYYPCTVQSKTDDGFIVEFASAEQEKRSLPSSVELFGFVVPCVIAKNGDPAELDRLLAQHERGCKREGGADQGEDGLLLKRRKCEDGRVPCPEVQVELSDVERVCAPFSTEERGSELATVEGYKSAGGCWHLWNELKNLPSRGVAAAPYVLDA